MKIARGFDPDADLVLYHGDCRDLMSKIPDEFVSLIITSPPYNIGKEYENRIDLQEYVSWHKEIIKECHRILKPNGSICWEVGNYVGKSEIYPLDMLLYSIFKDLEMKLRNRIVWFFRHGLHARKRFSGRYEVILWFTKSDSYTFNLDAVRVPQLYAKKKAYKGPRKGQISSHPKGKNPGDIWEDMIFDIPYDVWRIRNVHANLKEKTVHPAQFPEALVERLVKALSNKGDWVFDPFLGSGTTAVVAFQLGRRAIGAEIKEEYIDISWSRLRLSLRRKFDELLGI